MKLEMTARQFRRLLDLAYIGNWILNSTRGEDRITEYDEVESLLFGQAAANGMAALASLSPDGIVPSRAFAEGGIHEAIMEYEDTVFFEILAEELARRDMALEALDQNDLDELNARIGEYISEFERNGTDNISLK